jgi:hypothetical protein
MLVSLSFDDLIYWHQYTFRQLIILNETERNQSNARLQRRSCLAVLMKKASPHAASGREHQAGWELGDSDFRVLSLLHKGPLPVNTSPEVWLTPGSISVAVDRLVRRTGFAQGPCRGPGDGKGRALITRGFGSTPRQWTAVGVLSKKGS